MPTAAYDDIADWYEHEFLTAQRSAPDRTDFADTLGIDQALMELLGPGRGVCLELGCGTGIYADRLRGLGWEPLGVDISSGMLAHARARLPAAQGDATKLPFKTGSLSTVIAVMVHTDMPQYQSVLAEVHRVLAPGGQFVHVGVHPCFCGGFADRSDREAVVIRPGYLDGQWTTNSWTDQGVRDKVGAVHYPLALLLNHVRSTGFTLDRFAEGSAPTPVTLSFRATRT